LASLAVVTLVHLLLARLLPGFPRILDLFFVLTVLNGLNGKSLNGLLGGMACGLVQDAFSGAPYGLHGFADTLVGYATAKVAQRLVTRRFTGLLLVLFCMAALQQAILLLLGIGLVPNLNVPAPLWLAMRAVLSSVAGFALHSATHRLQVRLAEARRNRRARLRLE